jgi:hypothetical protein
VPLAGACLSEPHERGGQLLRASRIILSFVHNDGRRGAVKLGRMSRKSPGLGLVALVGHGKRDPGNLNVKLGSVRRLATAGRRAIRRLEGGGQDGGNLVEHGLDHGDHE